MTMIIWGESPDRSEPPLIRCRYRRIFTFHESSDSPVYWRNPRNCRRSPIVPLNQSKPNIDPVQILREALRTKKRISKLFQLDSQWKWPLSEPQPSNIQSTLQHTSTLYYSSRPFHNALVRFALVLACMSLKFSTHRRANNREFIAT